MSKDTVAITVKLPKNMHKQLKMAATATETSMQAIVKSQVTAYLQSLYAKSGEKEPGNA